MNGALSMKCGKASKGVVSYATGVVIFFFNKKTAHIVVFCTFLKLRTFCGCGILGRLQRFCQNNRILHLLREVTRFTHVETLHTAYPPNSIVLTTTCQLSWLYHN